MNDVVEIFEAIGDLETVLAKLKQTAPYLVAEIEELEEIQEGLIDDALDRGDDLSLDVALESESSELPESPEDSTALEQSATSEDETDAGWLSNRTWKKLFQRKMKKRKKILCATHPKLKRTRKGKQVWFSMIRYKRQDGSAGQLFRVVGRDPHKRPQAVTLSGKKLRWC